MGKLLRENKLKLTSGGFDVSATYRGMAHFAGSGPRATCRECQNWSVSGVKRGVWGDLKDGPCSKYTELMREPGPGVPHSALACKYFEPGHNPPPIHLARERGDT